MPVLVKPRSWGQQKPPVGAQINWGHPLAQGLAGAFLLNEQAGPRLTDITSLGNGTTQGVSVDPRWGPDGIFPIGTSATSFVFPASAYQFTGPMSIVARVFPASLTGDVAVKCDSSNTNIRNYGLDLNNTGGPRFYVQDSGGTFYVASAASGVIPAKVWSQQAGTYDGATVRLYANGHLANSTAGPSAIRAAGQLAFGQLGGSAAEFYTGYIGHVFLWSRALTGNEIAWLAAEPYAFITPPGPKILYIVGTAANTFNQALTVTQTQTPSMIRSVGKIATVTQTQTPTIVRSIGKLINAAQSQAATLVRSVGKMVAVTAAQTATVTKGVAHAITATCSQVGSVTKGVGKSFSVVQSQTASIVAVLVAGVAAAKGYAFARARAAGSWARDRLGGSGSGRDRPGGSGYGRDR